jgi:hypothetical protein
LKAGRRAEAAAVRARHLLALAVHS